MEVEKIEIEAQLINSQNGIPHSNHKSTKNDSQQKSDKIDFCFYYFLFFLAIPVLSSQPYSPRGPQHRFVSLLYHQFPVAVNNSVANSLLGKGNLRFFID